MARSVKVSVLEAEITVQLTNGMSVGSFLCSVYEKCLSIAPDTAVGVLTLVSPELGMLYHNKMDHWQSGLDSITLVYPNSIPILQKHLTQIGAFLMTDSNHRELKNIRAAIDETLQRNPIGTNTSISMSDYCAIIRSRVVGERLSASL